MIFSSISVRLSVKLYECICHDIKKNCFTGFMSEIESLMLACEAGQDVVRSLKP